VIKLSDYVVQFIEGLGVDHIFLLSGGGCMHLLDSVGKSKKINYVCNLHEQASAIAADAYSQYTNNIGVALVTTGPGGTNAITGVAASWLDSIPVMVFSGQVKTSDLAKSRGIRQMGFQEIDIVSLVKPITKYAHMVTEPETIKYHLEKALYMAKTGRPGPVWIDVPLDVQAAVIDERTLIGFEIPTVDVHENDLKEKVENTIALLNKAKRPVILVGNGVRLSGAINEFLELAKTLNIPVLTTWKSIDFMSEDNELFVGRPGAVGQRGANFSQQNADFILILGARLDYGQTGYNHVNFARAAKKVMVDIDENEINKMKTVIDVRVPYDAKLFLNQILNNKEKIKKTDSSEWLKRCKVWQREYPVILPEYFKEDYVNNYALIDTLSDLMTEEDILVPGSSGASSEVTMQAFRVKEGQRIFNSEGLGPMGFGISAAIGACLASKRRTICVDGDGGFYMNVQELEIVIRLNLPIKFFVLNNQGYASIRTTQSNYFNGRFVASDLSSGLSLPDTEKIANAFGIKYFKVSENIQLKSVVSEILECDGPGICEVLLSFNHVTSPKLSSYQKPDGSMVSRPLEDLAPFLSRDELKRNMLIPVLEEE
jgi:acetolactate synthase I/II/III large subunit